MVLKTGMVCQHQRMIKNARPSGIICPGTNKPPIRYLVKGEMLPTFNWTFPDGWALRGEPRLMNVEGHEWTWYALYYNTEKSNAWFSLLFLAESGRVIDWVYSPGTRIIDNDHEGT